MTCFLSLLLCEINVYRVLITGWLNEGKPGKEEATRSHRTNLCLRLRPQTGPQVGEDVPDARKCACASHVATIADFFQVSGKPFILLLIIYPLLRRWRRWTKLEKSQDAGAAPEVNTIKVETREEPQEASRVSFNAELHRLEQEYPNNIHPDQMFVTRFYALC